MVWIPRTIPPTRRQTPIHNYHVGRESSEVYGLNRVDFNKTIYVTEGPFDSLYIDNAIAMAGADVDWNLLEG